MILNNFRDKFPIVILAFHVDFMVDFLEEDIWDVDGEISFLHELDDVGFDGLIGHFDGKQSSEDEFFVYLGREFKVKEDGDVFGLEFDVG
jgi:hypothetical protein